MTIKYRYFFQNQTGTLFAHEQSQYSVKAENLPEISQEEFIELIIANCFNRFLFNIQIWRFWIMCGKFYSGHLVMKSKHSILFDANITFVMLLLKLSREFQIL
ncbi:hypothetical protein RF11_02379 [Thelohanellus kitauei]|uniref:Uncharacterized protein n=1 Tax=Thelohanellus kitauei TaxID=669202 RepID=A0A0C2MJM7_THEKT|nr:hypothetical protein RF11_02379 [Thelohanellus kitauei]